MIIKFTTNFQKKAITQFLENIEVCAPDIPKEKLHIKDIEKNK